jgi:hypothetical protein
MRRMDKMSSAENVRPSSDTEPNERVMTRHIWQKVAVVVLVLALMSLSSAAAYYFSHKNSNELSANLSSSNKKVKDLEQQQAGLNEQIASLTAWGNTLDAKISKLSSTDNQTMNTPETSVTSNAVPTSLSMTVSVLGGQKYSPSSNINDIAVDVTLTNTSGTTLSIPVSDFKLFDETNDESTDFATYAGTTMSNGFTVLNDLTLSPGQKVTGALVFDVLDSNYQDYTLGYGVQTYPVTINQ